MPGCSEPVAMTCCVMQGREASVSLLDHRSSGSGPRQYQAPRSWARPCGVLGVYGMPTDLHPHPPISPLLLRFDASPPPPTLLCYRQ